jgi:hypothetical protein
MSEFVDINSLIPDMRGFRFKDKSGKNHKLKMFIPVSATLVQEKFKDDKHNLQGKFLESVCSQQFEFMTMEWFYENVSLEIQNAVYSVLVNHVNMAELNTHRLLTGKDVNLEKKNPKIKRNFLARLFRK